VDVLNSVKLDSKTAVVLSLTAVCVTAAVMARNEKGPELLKGFAAVLVASAGTMKLLHG
jgi:hypothetical protein